jgi:hypothetical protein
MPGKFFSFLGKNMISPEKFNLVCPENFFSFSRKKLCDISGKIFGPLSPTFLGSNHFDNQIFSNLDIQSVEFSLAIKDKKSVKICVKV